MKAAVINKFGGPQVLEIVGNHPDPAPKKDQLLVEVHASSINPFDVKLMSGKTSMQIKFPAILGGDYAGIVKEVGEGVTKYQIGDEVYGSAQALGGGSGSYAQLAATNVANSAHKPKKVTFEEAAALPLVGASAVQALEEHIKLKSGQKILIHGGAGGIGHIAVQIAKKALGAYVVATAGTNDLDYVKSLGASEVIDYKTQKFEDVVKDMDAVFDTVGGDTTNKSFQVLKKGAIIVSMLGIVTPELATKYNVMAIGQGTQTNASHLARLAELVDDDKVKVHIDKVFTLDQIHQAFTYQKEGNPRGKVVIKINS